MTEKKDQYDQFKVEADQQNGLFTEEEVLYGNKKIVRCVPAFQFPQEPEGKNPLLYNFINERRQAGDPIIAVRVISDGEDRCFVLVNGGKFIPQQVQVDHLNPDGQIVFSETNQYNPTTDFAFILRPPQPEEEVKDPQKVTLRGTLVDQENPYQVTVEFNQKPA